MTITYHDQFDQGSQQWLDARCGLLTASEMKLIVTPTLKLASNDKERTHLYELLAQRITKYVEPHYISDDMLRGHVEEVTARNLYSERFAPVREVGFVTNDRWGFTLGCSPDGLVGDDGQLENKSRRQKFQVQTIVEHVGTNTCPADFLIQVQTALLVTEREWCDFISYSGGLPMAVVRIYPDDAVQGAIIEAAAAFEARLADKLARFTELAADLIPTERTVELEMHL